LPFAGSGCATASNGGRGRPNLELLALQSTTSCGLTFGNGLRAVSG
jgi:hypothetical protein